MADLESLKTVTTFSFFSSNIENGVNEFSTFGVVTLGPVVSGSGLTEDEVVRSEELTERSCSNGVHGAGFQIHKDGSGDVSSSGGFVVVDVDSFQLEVGVSVVGSGGINSVLV